MSRTTPSVPAPAAALLVAGGRGARFGAEVPKQFLPLGGRPLFVHAAAVLDASPCIDHWVLVVPIGWDTTARAALAASGADRKLAAVVAGGATRQESVRNGLAALAAHAVACGLGPAAQVLVQDAARPFLTPHLVEATLAAARQTGAATVATPVADTLVRAATDARLLAEVLDRDGVWSVQTPQAFSSDVLHAAHEWASVHAHQGTDDGGLVRQIGRPVALVPGPWWNFKVTRREDFERAELLLELRDRLREAED